MEHVRRFVFLSHYFRHCCIVQALAKGAQCPQQTNTSSDAFNNSPEDVLSGFSGLLEAGIALPGQEDCVHNHFTSFRRLHISLQVLL
jgi:hypothetical protein